MTFLIRESLDHLKAGTPFALATIIAHQGSTPRTSGSRMLVRTDRTISGTIGGGLVEAKVIDASARMMEKACDSQNGDSLSRVMDFSLDRELKQGMDMVCGGSLSVWIQAFIPPFPPSLTKIYDTLADLEARGEKALAVTRVHGTQGPDTCIAFEDGRVLGPQVLPVPLMTAIAENRFSGPGPFRQFYGMEEFIIHPLGQAHTLFIFGAGHVGYQLAKMAGLTDFRVAVIDDRSEFANAQRFPQAAVHVIKDFSRAFEELDITGQSYIVILTRGHLHDQTVLEQALKTPAPYIGMIGSKKKRDQIYANLMEKGVEKSALDKVYSPIGTRIMAETPAEIAVSITGELIKARALGKDS